MINQVKTSIDRSVFAPLQSNGAMYAISKPFTETQKNEHEKEKEKRGNKLGYAIASGALVVGFGVLLVTRLLSKKPPLPTDKLFKILDDKTAKLGGNKQLNDLQTLYFHALKGAKNLLNKSKVIFNAATLKDILFRRGLKKVPILRQFSDATTKLFEKISVRTSTRSYSRTSKNFDKMYETFTEANAKVLNKEQVQNLEEKILKIKTNYDKGFGEDARNQRLIKTKKDLEKIDEEVWGQTYKDLTGFAKKARNGEFIAEEAAAKPKLELGDKVNALKKEITISVYDHYEAMNGLVKNIAGFVDLADKDSRRLMKGLKTHLTSYQKALELGGNKANIPQKSDVIKDLNELDSYILNSGKYDKEISTKASESINNLIKALSNNKQGEIQDVLDVYKQNLSKEDYAKLKTSVTKALKSLNHSVDLETDKLFDKVRDLYLGSAPHDALAFFASLGVVGWYLAKADDADERISAALKFGIPAIGAVAIATICTVGLIASGHSLLIGGISGLAINKLGEAVDEWRKKGNEKQ